MLEWLTALWLPILVSAVGVYAASSLIHMVFKWHHADYKKFPNEDDVRAAIRAGNTQGGGEYMLPYCASPKDAGLPEMQKKFQEGPIGLLIIGPPGVVPGMGKPLILWFAFNLVTAAIIGYVAYKALLTPYTFGQVARLTGGLAFLAYATGGIQYGIWMGKPWKSVAKDVLDAAIYATITAVAFAMLWKP
jgi:hypothetical protein